MENIVLDSITIVVDSLAMVAARVYKSTMKNIKVFPNFKNSSTVVLISIPKNIVVQQAEEIVDYT
jgi:hypothetical protein